MANILYLSTGTLMLSAGRNNTEISSRTPQAKNCSPGNIDGSDKQVHLHPHKSDIEGTYIESILSDIALNIYLKQKLYD